MGVARHAGVASNGYRRILVPLLGKETGSAVDVACRLAAERGATITAVAVVEVPPALPLDAHMRDEEAAAHRVLEHALAVGESYGVTVTPRLLRGRRAESVILTQAADSELLLLDIEPGEKVDRLARRVLHRAPCRVLLLAGPRHSR